MLKRRMMILCMVALMLALPVVAAADSHVAFKDDNLEAAVIKEFANLGKVVEVSKIPQADMKLLKKLYAEGIYAAALPGAESAEVIRDLTGLNYALKLELLDISGNFVKDLAPIRNLPLSFLNIQGNVDDDDTPAFSLNPSSPQMKILQEIQHRGAVVWHDGLVSRISGPDRYQTAVRIWQNMYTLAAGDEDVVEYYPGNTIVLARGDDFADALVGAPLAWALANDIEAAVPVLLTTSNKLHPATKSALVNYVEKFEDELIDMGSIFDVYVLGGTAAISEAVVNELIYAIETEFDALDVRAIRVGGADRYATSVAVAKKVVDVYDDDFINDPIIATGEYFPDALTAAPYAAFEGRPILLTNSSSLPASVSDFLKDQGKEAGVKGLDVVVAGGAAAVSENVISQLNKLKFRAGGTDNKVFDTVTRVWGADRYATAVELGKEFGAIDKSTKKMALGMGDEQLVDSGFMYVATGEDFADALTGAPLAALNETGILLVKQNSIPSSVEKVIDFQSNKKGEPTAYLDILGGEAAVSLHNAVTMYNLVRYPAWAPR